MKKNNTSVTSLMVFACAIALVGCESNLSTSKAATPNTVKKQLTAGNNSAILKSSATASPAAIVGSGPTLDMTQALPGSWTCSEKLSAPTLCATGETVVIPTDMQSLTVSIANQDPNNDGSASCDLSQNYKLVTNRSTTSNTLSGSITLTDESLQGASKTDPDCEKIMSQDNQSTTPVSFSATFAINAAKSGNTLTLSLSSNITKVYIPTTTTTTAATTTATTTAPAAPADKK